MGRRVDEVALLAAPLSQPGRAVAHQGDAAQALEFAEECLKLAEPTMSRKNLVKGWRLKGQALLAQGQEEQAQEALLGR